MVNFQTLSSLAMLKVNIDGGGDYLDYLLPFVLEAISNNSDDIITDSLISDEIASIFGLTIPHRTIQIILRRLTKRRFLTRSDGVYRVTGNIPIPDNTEEKVNADRHIDFIVKSLVEYSKLNSEKILTEDDAVDCLILFLSQFSINCLRYYLRGTTLPNVENSDWKIHLIGQFVTSLGPELLNSFMILAQGNMIANALLCPDLQSVSDTYSSVTFYLDTPLLIQLLGLEGEHRREAIVEVVELVERLGGKISYFSHTLDELTTSINGAAGYVDSLQGRGRIVEESRRANRTKSDLLLMAGEAADKLLAMGIERTTTPSYDPRNFAFEIGEEIFGSVLDEEVNYLNPRAKSYDIQSVRSIYILRRGSAPNSIEKATAVLVTSNAGFSKAAYDYGKNFEQSREVSPVITDFSLANTAWLKAPQGAPSLPRKEVLAFAYAALRPTTQYWAKVLLEAEKLEKEGGISARGHQLLRSSYLAQDELMKLTLGEDDALTATSLQATINRVSDEIRKEETAQLNESEARRVVAEQSVMEHKDKIERIKQSAYWRIMRRAKIEGKILSIVIWIAQIFITVFGIFRISDQEMAGYVAALVGGLSGAVRLVGTWIDIKPLKLMPVFIEWRVQKLLKREYAALSIE